MYGTLLLHLLETREGYTKLLHKRMTLLQSIPIDITKFIDASNKEV